VRKVTARACDPERDLGPNGKPLIFKRRAFELVR